MGCIGNPENTSETCVVKGSNPVFQRQVKQMPKDGSSRSCDTFALRAGCCHSYSTELLIRSLVASRQFSLDIVWLQPRQSLLNAAARVGEASQDFVTCIESESDLDRDFKVRFTTNEI